MNLVPKISRWREGRVDRMREHFELRYESTVKFACDWNDWIPVAVIGASKAYIVNVQFLVEPDDPKNLAAVSDARKEIQFYLIDKKEPDPWGYARCHCGTFSNVYSKVHCISCIILSPLNSNVKMSPHEQGDSHVESKRVATSGSHFPMRRWPLSVCQSRGAARPIASAYQTSQSPLPARQRRGSGTR